MHAPTRTKTLQNAPKTTRPQDTPLPIGYSQTISAPHMHAICLQLLQGHLAPVSWQVKKVSTVAAATSQLQC